MSTKYEFFAGDIITITNNRSATAFPLDDAGSRTGPYAETGTVYQNQDVEIPIYLSNLVQVLEPGDSVEITASSASESMYYQKVATDLGLDLEVTNAGGEG